MTEKLLACPFCGCKAVWFKTGRDIGIECEDGFDCPGRAQTNTYAPEHRADVIAQWNRRVLPSGEDIRELLYTAATQALPASGEAWQPIETAPRDSRRILVAVADGPDDRQKVREAWWRIPYEGAANEHGYWCYDGKSTMLDKSVHGIGATHWQPLPAAPTSTPSAAKKD